MGWRHRTHAPRASHGPSDRRGCPAPATASPHVWSRGSGCGEPAAPACHRPHSQRLLGLGRAPRFSGWQGAGVTRAQRCPHAACSPCPGLPTVCPAHRARYSPNTRARLPHLPVPSQHPRLVAPSTGDSYTKPSVLVTPRHPPCLILTLSPSLSPPPPRARVPGGQGCVLLISAPLSQAEWTTGADGRARKAARPVLPRARGPHLHGDHGQDLHRDAVELVEAAPGPRLRQALVDVSAGLEGAGERGWDRAGEEEAASWPPSAPRGAPPAPHSWGPGEASRQDGPLPRRG